MNAARSRPDGAAHQAAASRRLISSRSPSSCTPGSHSSTSSDRSRRSLHCPASTPPSRSSSSPRTPMSIRPARSSSWPRATSSTRPGRRSPSSSPAAGSHPHRVRQPEIDRQRLDGGIERRDRHLGVHRRADPRSPPPASSTTGQPPPIGHTSTSSKASALSTSTHGGSKTASTSPPPACQPASTAASTSPPGTSAKKPPPSSSEPPSASVEAAEGVELTDEQRDAIGLLWLLYGQDVEPGERPGTWRIAESPNTCPRWVLLGQELGSGLRVGHVPGGQGGGGDDPVSGSTATCAF